jgi:hypothetical protein
MTTPQRAKRQKLIAAVEIAGPSGAGKTLSALIMAYGMMKEAYPELDDYDLWGKIGLIDTEHERSLVYVGKDDEHTHGVAIGEYWHQPLIDDYSVSKYEKCVKALKDCGCEVVIIDSITHAWTGDNGLLDLQKSKGGTIGAWRDVNPTYNRFIKLVTGETYRVHTISTVRLKQDYQVEQSETGKLQVKKMGLKHEQRDMLEYEFQIVFTVDMDHAATTSKDNSGLFEGRRAFITPEHGKKLIQWLDKGIDVKGKEEEDRQEFIKMIRDAEATFNGPIAGKIKEIEDKMKRPIEELPFNLVQLAWKRIEETINQMESEKQEA